MLNSLFALVYFAIGVEQLTNINSTAPLHQFMDAFFFSAQSLTTVGYGRVAPASMATSTVATIESFAGLLAFALITGLLFARFSRPNAKILRSRNMIISPYQNGKALMFRIANMRESQLIDVEVQVTMKRNVMENGNPVRQFLPIHLVSHRLNMFPLTWTLIHILDEHSPLHGKTLLDYLNEDVEILIYFKGYDETFSNTVHSRMSYKASELVEGARFILNFEERPDGPTIHYLNRISDYEPVPLHS
jgi:inward rectifier potassium channel